MGVRAWGKRRRGVGHCPREEWLTLGVARRQPVTYGVNDPGFANPFARRGHFVPRRFGKEEIRAVGRDLPRHEALRVGLPQRLGQSPLMVGNGFARGIEEAYRVMRQKWCAQHC